MNVPRALRPALGAAAVLVAVPVAAGPAAATGAATGAAAARVHPASLQQFPDRPLLRLGDTGPSVAAWQRQLRIVTGADLAVDGIYGSTTEQATANFQRFFDLTADGIVGEDTRGLMRYILAVSEEYTHLATYDDLEVAGWTSEGGYCIEARAGDSWGVECTPLPPYPVSAQAIDLDGSSHALVGGADPSIASVRIETTDGQVVEADLHPDVRGVDQQVWTTPVDPADVYAIRAYDAGGDEVRAIVLEGTQSIQILERGDRGPAVAAWQGKLNAVSDAGLATDGVFGMRTVEKTRDFQRFFGLTVDGIVGPETREVMQYVLAL